MTIWPLKAPLSNEFYDSICRLLHRHASRVILGPNPFITKRCTLILLDDTTIQTSSSCWPGLSCWTWYDAKLCFTTSSWKNLHVVMSKYATLPKALENIVILWSILSSKQNVTPAVMGIHDFSITTWNSLFPVTQLSTQANTFSFSAPAIILTNLKWDLVNKCSF